MNCKKITIRHINRYLHFSKLAFSTKKSGGDNVNDRIKETVNVGYRADSGIRIFDFPQGYFERPILRPNDYADSALISDESGRRVWAVIPFQSRTPASSRLWLQGYISSKTQGSLEQKALSKKEPKGEPKERKLIEKRMEDSLVQVFLPFKSDPSIRDDYMNTYGGVRISKVLEDLDALAGSVSYLHCDDGDDQTPPLTIVTAAVERIDLLQRMSLEQDYRLFGFVTFVGSSSMEITIQMDLCDHYSSVEWHSIEDTSDRHKIPEGFQLVVPNPVLVAKFTMVARDKETGKAVRVNPLNLVTAQERDLCAQGMLLKSKKLFAAQMALSKKAPTLDELQLIHQLYLKSLNKDSDLAKENAVWMDQTVMESHVLCMPQDRNIHGFVFGGYLMKLAYELAYSNALLFSSHRPFFLSLDDISFQKPVPVGSLVRFTSEIVYSSGSLDQTYQVRVDAAIVNQETKETQTTNEFQFTFYTTSKSLPRVVPKTYAEAMRLIDGLRRKRASKIVNFSDFATS